MDCPSTNVPVLKDVEVPDRTAPPTTANTVIAIVVSNRRLPLVFKAVLLKGLRTACINDLSLGRIHLCPEASRPGAVGVGDSVEPGSIYIVGIIARYQESLRGLCVFENQARPGIIGAGLRGVGNRFRAEGPGNVNPRPEWRRPLRLWRPQELLLHRQTNSGRTHCP